MRATTTNVGGYGISVCSLAWMTSLVQATEGIRLSESIHCLTRSIVIMLASRGAADARRTRSTA
jgi:hypothetical protein